jgi:hypothetical protein
MALSRLRLASLKYTGVKMLEVLDHQSLGELTPVAEIDPAIELFYRKNIKFTPDHDEWGAHHIAAFRTDDLEPFAVLHYDHDPREKAHLFILRSIPAEGPATLIAGIAAALDLPQEAFRWRDDHGEMVSLAPKKAA